MNQTVMEVKELTCENCDHGFWAIVKADRVFICHKYAIDGNPDNKGFECWRPKVRRLT
jgi:hypothetical protein